MAGTKRTLRKAKKSLKVKKTALRDLPVKGESTGVKGGMAPPYSPVGPGKGNY